jgi:hypothetical protein
MPPLNPIKILGNLAFFSKNLKLGTEWDSAFAIGDAAGYVSKFGTAAPHLSPPWFMPAEPKNSCFQEACDKVGQDFKDFHDGMIDAVQYSHNMWKLQAKFQNLQIVAVTAIGAPGCLDGPELESNIKNAPMCAGWSGNKAKHRDAVAKGVSQCCKKWQDKVMVPGLPWYPAFAAFPGPMAPPMPNVPMPLIACPSAMMSEIITPDSMAKAMDDALDADLKKKDKTKQYEALHFAIATVLSLAFLLWLPQQQVMLVLGKGPIPTFAPPFVPVGPVMGGDVISTPGHLMA